MTHHPHDESTSNISTDREEEESLEEVEAKRRSPLVQRNESEPLLSTSAIAAAAIPVLRGSASPANDPEIAKMFEDLNRLPPEKIYTNGFAERWFANQEIVLRRFVQGAFAPMATALLATYSPITWLEFLKPWAGVLLTTGLGLGTANAVLGIVEKYYAPATNTPDFIAQLNELHNRMHAESLALARLLMTPVDDISAAEKAAINFTQDESALDILPETEYIKLSTHHAPVLQTIRQLADLFFDANNYAVGGLLVTIMAATYLEKEEELNTQIWAKAITAGFCGLLGVHAAVTANHVARVESSAKLSANKEVVSKIYELKRLNAINEENVEKLITRFNLEPLDAAQMRRRAGYGTGPAVRPALEELQETMAARVLHVSKQMFFNPDLEHGSSARRLLTLGSHSATE